MTRVIRRFGTTRDVLGTLQNLSLSRQSASNDASSHDSPPCADSEDPDHPLCSPKPVLVDDAADAASSACSPQATKDPNAAGDSSHVSPVPIGKYLPSWKRMEAATQLVP
jgi:hypothetical protein